jgi:hypothetical protein
MRAGFAQFRDDVGIQQVHASPQFRNLTASCSASFRSKKLCTRGVYQQDLLEEVKMQGIVEHLLEPSCLSRAARAEKKEGVLRTPEQSGRDIVFAVTHAFLHCCCKNAMRIYISNRKMQDVRGCYRLIF